MKRVPVTVLSVALVAIATGASAASVKFTSAQATPVGIKLEGLGAGQGLGMEGSASGGYLPPHRTAFADATGMTLYTYGKDQPGKSTCVDECAKTFPPAVARDDAKPFGDWSVIKRDDGTKQWALKGKPLYTYVEDKLPGSLNGQLIGRGRAPQAASAKAMGQEWAAAYYEPEADIQMPRGLAIKDISDAGGRGFVTAEDQLTIYAYEGDPNKDKPNCAAPCTSPWKPLAAPQIATGVGDFSVVVRNDGIKQWAYKGAALYTFEGDRAVGYANGMGVDKRWRVAIVSAYYMPPEVKMERTLGRGLVLATTKGQTLYRHDAVAYQTGAGHSLRRGVIVRPGVGRQIGTGSCDTACQQRWHPYLAPATAQPTGYWEIFTRADGTRQWGYKGFAMYTYDGDKKPGEMNGNDTYDIAMQLDPTKKNDVGTPQIGAPALYWLIAEP